MEPLDTILYEEGTQVPLNPHTTSSQVSHKDTTVEQALGETVNFIPQGLTPEQQTQARENINALGDEAGVINEEHIATGAVTADKIKDDAVTTPKIADGAITNEKLGAKAVTISSIADGAVTTPKIADEAITEDKLASQSVSSNKIKDDAVTGDKIGDGAVTSTKLAMGARKPIILTPATTEVNEETYQKLLSDDVDVVFNAPDGEFCTLTYEDANTDYSNLYFTCFSVEGETLDDIYIYAYRVEIEKNAPHTCTTHILREAQTLSDEILSSNYIIQQSQLSSVLQEIDLTGTDEEIKAKLDQFARNWKTLTGANTLEGARFIGKLDINQMLVGCIFAYNSRGYFDGISLFNEENYQNFKVSIFIETGATIVTPLFSHLEAITIRIDNTPESKAANVAAIEAYEDNLEALGFDMTKGYMIPITASGRNGFLSTRSGNYPYVGYASADSSVSDFYNILILGNGEYYDSKIQSEGSGELHTISKRIVPAINEVHALAKGYSALLAPIELTTDPVQNKTAIDARVAAFTAQGISLTNGYCIPVTYKGVYAGNIFLINGDWYGLLVKNTNNPADNINIKLSADGTVTTSNSAQ